MHKMLFFVSAQSVAAELTDHFNSGHFVKKKKTGLKLVFPLIFTEVQKESRRGSVPDGSMERFCHAKWNLDLINLINCTCIYRHFSHQHGFCETGL